MSFDMKYPKKDVPADLPRHAFPDPGAEVTLRSRDDGGVTVSFSDGSNDLVVSRREFVRISGVAAATAAMAGSACRNPVEKIVPYVDRPEETRIGQFSSYATVWNGVGILAKTRAGRPVKLEGNPNHPVSKGALGARGQASYVNLYDPDRAKSPQAIVGDSPSPRSIEDSDREIVNILKQAGSTRGIRILTSTTTGSAQRALMARLTRRPNVKHYTYEPVNDEASLAVHAAGYGLQGLPHYRFDRADVIVSLGSDFLGTWVSPTEYTWQFSQNRNPDKKMSQLIAFEGAHSLTGAAADVRHRVRHSDLPYVALAIANELGVAAASAFTAAKVAEHTGLKAEDIQSTAKALKAAKGKAVVVAGGTASAQAEGLGLEAAVALINDAIGAPGKTLELDRVSRQSLGSASGLRELVAEIKAGKVNVLIIAGTNPVYSAPAELGLAEALDSVPTVISCADRVDETAVHAKFLSPASHYLESWGDAEPFDGVYTIQQPVIRPLYETRSFEASLITWFGLSGLDPQLAGLLQGDAVPAGNLPGSEDQQKASYRTGPWYRFVREHWRASIFPKASSVADFDTFWESVLREGIWYSPSAKAPRAPRLNAGALAGFIPKEMAKRAASNGLSGKELVLFPTVGLGAGDGADANNGHLLELPDPITRTTWDAYVMVSPKTFRDAGLSNGDIVTIKAVGGEQGIDLPIIMVPGVHDDVVAVPLGFGRTRVGEVGDGLGANGYALSSFAGEKDGRQLLAGIAVDLKPTGENREHAIPQGSQVIDLHKRTFVAVTTAEAYTEDKTAGIHKHPPLDDFWKDHDYPVKWGMSVDLTKCTGCSACVIACQEENNTPVVGRQGIIEGREMHWMRIDRYYKLPEDHELHEKRKELFGDPMYSSEPYVAMSEYLDNPRMIYQPIMCQHCENAPCETVCPVLATMHSSDGLNQMAYNRCVGTRYCANNCPFKVRRFNWYNYSEDRSEQVFAAIYPELKAHARNNVKQPLPLGFNPEVTVRSRGVMEKCTFCVQRIRRAKWQAREERRSKPQDGDVVTACQQACPAQAIEFGNLSDPNSRVSRAHARARALSPLGEIGVESSVAYLTQVINGPVVDHGYPPGAGGHGGHAKKGGHAEGEHEEEAH
jgi:molybdopterin-containing oxidoreductase family iron-sulfur binding subunit